MSASGGFPWPGVIRIAIGKHRLDGGDSVAFILAGDAYVQDRSHRGAEGQNAEDTAQIGHLFAAADEDLRAESPRDSDEPCGGEEVKAFLPGNNDAGSFHLGTLDRQNVNPFELQGGTEKEGAVYGGEFEIGDLGDWGFSSQTLMNFLRIVSACFLVFCVTSLAEDGVADLPIGAPAPEFNLPGIDGKSHKLGDYKDGKLLMVFFTSNHCPTSHGVEERLKKFLADYRGKGLTFVAINPNHPDGLSIDELGYSKYNDSFEDMKKYAADCGFDFPYLYDGETQAVAKAYGCLATPHLFLFDAERKLRYKGRFDDSRFAEESTVKSHDARNAVEALLSGKPVPVEVTQPHGCSTKWRSKQTNVAKQKEKWDKTPVDVEPIEASGIAALRKNPTKKLRLINVWATWCGPCVAEVPELVRVARQFDMRDFEFISISADEPKDAAAAKAFLEKQAAGLSDRLKASVKAEGRKTNSYLFKGANPDELMKTVDPQWPGGIPHTVLVAPGGEIVWRHNGVVDGDALRGKILEVLGNYYKP